MNTPGFTAHNSLYQSNRHYVAGLISSWSPSATVVPLFRAPIKFSQGEGGDCHERCGPCLSNCMQSCTNTCYGEAPPYEKACCAPTQTCCSGECFNTTSDAKNCGVCDKACPGGWFCVDGVCQPCKPGFTLCDGDCVDTKSNGANCGACGKECTGGRECIDGRCKCPGNSTFCGGVCTWLDWDWNNCGACGVSCSNGCCYHGICGVSCGSDRCCPLGTLCIFGECI